MRKIKIKDSYSDGFGHFYYTIKRDSTYYYIKCQWDSIEGTEKHSYKIPVFEFPEFKKRKLEDIAIPNTHYTVAHEIVMTTISCKEPKSTKFVPDDF